MPSTTALAPTTTAQPSRDWEPYRDITVLVSTDRDSYAEGEPVRITVDVCNEGTEAHRFQIYEGQEVIASISDDDGDGVAFGMGEAGDFVWYTWEPGQCRAYDGFLWWHQRHHMGDEPMHGAIPAPAGGYRATGEFTGQPERERTVPPPDNGPRGTSERFELDGVTVAVTTDKAEYSGDEPVVVTAHVCNPSERVHTQTFWWSPEAEIRLGRDGYTLANNDVTGPTDEYSRTFLPGECVDYRYVWTDPRSAGEYDVAVLWWGHTRADIADSDRHRPGWIEQGTFTVT